MDKQHFDKLVKGVREMKRHMAGKTARGARTTVLFTPDVRTIREAAQISQSQFAKLIGVNLHTLQNWEQQRTQANGPARALLKVVASNPKAIEALHRQICFVSGRAKSYAGKPRRALISGRWPRVGENVSPVLQSVGSGT